MINFLKIESFVPCRTWQWLKLMYTRATNNCDWLLINETEVKNTTHKVGSLVQPTIAIFYRLFISDQKLKTK